jgi:F-type H+-transporting ATPase subunit b
MTTLLIPLASEGGSPLALEWPEVIASLVFIGILVFIITKYVVPRFEATYAERTEAIQGGMEKAEKAQEAAEAALREYEAQLADARAEAARIEMREQAQAEAARIKTQAEASLEAERNQLMSSLRNEIGGLATTLAGRIVGESMTDDERARRTVDRFLADLENDDAAEPARQS